MQTNQALFQRRNLERLLARGPTTGAVRGRVLCPCGDTGGENLVGKGDLLVAGARSLFLLVDDAGGGVRVEVGERGRGDGAATVHAIEG